MNTIKKFLFLLSTFLFSTLSHAGEWYAFSTDYVRIENQNFFNTSEVEIGIWAYIKDKSDRNFEEKNSYNYQFIVLGPNKYKIFAHCNNLGTDISKQMLIVDDGGSCFFDIFYDSSTKIFKDLYVNGHA